MKVMRIQKTLALSRWIGTSCESSVALSRWIGTSYVTFFITISYTELLGEGTTCPVFSGEFQRDRKHCFQTFWKRTASCQYKAALFPQSPIPFQVYSYLCYQTNFHGYEFKSTSISWDCLNWRAGCHINFQLQWLGTIWL